MDPDPDFSGSDPDFWPSRIRTQEKKSDPVKRTRIRNTGFEDTIHYGASGYNRFLGIFLCNYLFNFIYDNLQTTQKTALSGKRQK